MAFTSKALLHSRFFPLVIFVVLFPLIACGNFTLQVGVDDQAETPTTTAAAAEQTAAAFQLETQAAADEAAVQQERAEMKSTIAALTTENVRLAAEATSNASGAETTPLPPTIPPPPTSVPAATSTPVPVAASSEPSLPQPIIAGTVTSTPASVPVESEGHVWIVESVLVAPGEPGRLYVLQRLDESISLIRLLISDDFGESWEVFKDGLPVDGECLYNLNLDYAALDALYASTCEGLYRWSGEVWELISERETGMIAIVYNQPETIWATDPPGPTDSPVLRSDNGGQTWDSASRFLGHANGVANLAIDPQNTNTLYAIIRPGYLGSYLRRGTANGQWQEIPAPGGDTPLEIGFTLDGNSGAMYVTTATGNRQLWRSPNPAEADVNRVRWELVHDFGQNVKAELLASGWSPQGLALYANLLDESTSDRAVLYRSLDGGLTWEPLTIKF